MADLVFVVLILVIVVIVIVFVVIVGIVVIIVVIIDVVFGVRLKLQRRHTADIQVLAAFLADERLPSSSSSSSTSMSALHSGQ
jgi:uncharacterized membrane protein YgcG